MRLHTSIRIFYKLAADSRHKNAFQSAKYNLPASLANMDNEIKVTNVWYGSGGFDLGISFWKLEMRNAVDVQQIYTSWCDIQLVQNA